MKFTTKHLISMLGLALLLLTSGCGESHAESAHAPEPAPAATYKAGHGIQLSPSAAGRVGIQTTEVTEMTAADGTATTVIPAGAVLRTVKGSFVYAANGPHFLRTPVVVGAAGANTVVIKDGLYPGDVVVSEGAQTLWLAELQAVNGGVGCADGH